MINQLISLLRISNLTMSPYQLMLLLLMISWMKAILVKQMVSMW